MDDNKQYTLGVSQAELERLGFQHQVWSRESSHLWEQAGFGGGMHLLDLGCGPGYASLALRQWVLPDGEITAVDRAPSYLEYLNHYISLHSINSITTSQQDVESLSFENSHFDGVFARWVLSFVADRKKAVHEIARVLKPGSNFATLDYYHLSGARLGPMSQHLSAFMDAASKTWRNDGGDPEFGVSLPSMLVEAGLEIKHLRPVIRIAQPGDALWRWPQIFFENYGPHVVEEGFLSEDAYKAFMNEWHKYSKRDDSFFATPPMIEIIACKK